MIFERILLPITKNDIPLTIVKKAIRLAKKLKINITAVFILNTTFFSGTIPPNQLYSYRYFKDIQEYQKQKAHTFLEKIQKIANQENIDIQTMILQGIPEKEVMKEAKKNDLIIISNDGTSTFNRIFLNSLSEKILHRLPSTVMIVR